ncbi:MAG: helix-turn-helix domain-containing protein [Actinomycetota bacterium]|nr:helix-turn-helix domain-containing protein [Actinomycetota bacterium]
MTTLQQQARALGDPTRYAVYRYLADAENAVGVAELTAHFQLNHNAIRQHLAKLLAAGLVTDTVAEAAGPGRRRLLYAIHPASDSRWGTAYERLSRLLVEIIRTGDSPVEVGMRAGRRYRGASSAGSDAVEDIAAAMGAQGFEPEIRGRPSRREIVLRNCPFESTAIADRETVCSLHLGMAEGLAEGRDWAVDELVANDPRRAHCRLRLVAVSPDDATTSQRGRLRLTRMDRPHPT